MKPILLSAAGNSENQDRGIVIQDDLRAVLCIADGAGGLSGGTEAAMMATEFVRQNAPLANSAESCSELLRHMDTVVAKDSAGGETTCALAIITWDEIFGASVGDSGVWMVPENGVHIDLTRTQKRKPFIGSGCAWPVPFQHPLRGGSLLLATDGLLKYTSADHISGIVRQHPVELAAQRLIELVRYPSGALPDDVTVILTMLTNANASP